MLLNSTIYPGVQRAAASDWKIHFLAALSALVEAQDGQDTETALLSAKVALVQADAELNDPYLKGSALVYAANVRDNARAQLSAARLSAEAPKSKLDPNLRGRDRVLAANDRDNASDPHCARYSATKKPL